MGEMLFLKIIKLSLTTGLQKHDTKTVKKLCLHRKVLFVLCFLNVNLLTKKFEEELAASLRFDFLCEKT